MPHQVWGAEAKPRVFFNTNAIVSHLWGSQVNGGDTKVEKLSKEILQEAWHEVAESTPSGGLDASRYHVGAGAGFPDLFYFLDQIRPWLGTVADVIALGVFGKAIIAVARERLGQDGKFIYLSREVLEAMCVSRVQEGYLAELGQVSVRSDGFETWFGKGEPADEPHGELVYLVWVISGDCTYQFLIDSSGRIWGEYRVNHGSGEIKRLGPETVRATGDT
jgi:hypothetical protein